MSKGINLEGDSLETIVSLADEVIQRGGYNFETVEVLGDLCQEEDLCRHPILKTLGSHHASMDESLAEGRSWKPDNTRTWVEKRLGVGQHEVLKTKEERARLNRREQQTYAADVLDWAKAIKATALYVQWPTTWELAMQPHLHIPDEAYYSVESRLVREDREFQRQMKRSARMLEGSRWL